MEKLDGKTMNVVQDNIEKMKELFPEVFTEDKIDFEKLQLTLGEHIETEKERYQFTWNGKTEAIQMAQKQSTGTLRPCKEESVDWDTTQNLYIEGDNLEVLRLLQNSYRNKVKMIYIDPPYNTGKDFVYKDNFHDNVKNYKESMVESYKSNAETNGRYHTDWLNMMYPRLKIAKNFLKDDGAIFVSIDDGELSNLKKICDEIYGESNFIGSFIWSGGRKNDSKYISVSHEYVLVYVKNIKYLIEKKEVWREKKQGLEEIYLKAKELIQQNTGDYQKASDDLKKWYRSLSNEHLSKQHDHYNTIDDVGVYFPGDISWPGGGGPIYDVKHPITNKVVKMPSRGWLFSKERMQEMIEKSLVHFGEDEARVPCFKRYLKDTEYQVPFSVIYQDSRGSMKRLRTLMGKKVFDFPKDENVLEKLFSLIASNDDIVMDFFSGSASSAHAIMNLNINESKNLKYIMVQLPELTDSKTEAYKSGFLNICEIGKERIRRAGQKIKEANINNPNVRELDIGFKVFKLDETNLKIWDENIDEIEDNLFSFERAVKEGRTQEDVVYEVLLKYGIDLTVSIEEGEIGQVTTFSIGMGYLVVCLDKNLTLGDIEQLVAAYPDCERMVFLDDGFVNDEVKINAEQILKRNGVSDIRVI